MEQIAFKSTICSSWYEYELWLYSLFFLVWLWTMIYNDQIDSGSNIQQDIPDKQVDKSTAIVSSKKNV